MDIIQTTPPAYAPVPLDQVKLHCRVADDSEDALLAAYLAAAAGTCQHLIGRSIMAQGWCLALDAWPVAVRLPNPVIQAVTSITYRDAEGGQQTLDPALYGLSGDLLARDPGADMPALWAGPGVVQVNYTAGYAAGDEATQQAAVPANIRSWLLLTVGTMYTHRESVQAGVAVAELPGRFVDGLLDAHRVY